MERRSLLKMLGLTPTLGLLVHSGSGPNETKETTFKGWTVKWSGWMPIVNQRLLVGNWVAVKPDTDIGVYSSVPGDCTWFRTGYMFDTCVREKEGQMFITPETHAYAAEKQKEMGLLRLLKFLDNPDPMPSYWRL